MYLHYIHICLYHRTKYKSYKKNKYFSCLNLKAILKYCFNLFTMYRYYNRIIETLIENLGISRYDLYHKCLARDKREFLTTINKLLREGEIEYEKDSDGGPVYYPITHWLNVFLKAGNIYFDKFRVNYIPSKVLQEELEYESPGQGYEDNLAFQMHIGGGYPIKEKYKAFFELHNNISLNFDKFSYSLTTVYYDKIIESDYLDKKKFNILYIDNNQSFATEFIKKVKKEFLPESKWTLLYDTGQAIYYLQNKLEVNEVVDIIITENNENLDGVEFIDAVRELEFEFKEKYIEFGIPILAFTAKPLDQEFIKTHTDGGKPFLHLLKSEDLYVVANIIKTSQQWRSELITA